MTNREILDKAINLAIAGGFGWLHNYGVESRYGELYDKKRVVEESYVIEYRDKERVFYREIAYQVIIFNHDFAKALWGEDRYGKTLEGILNLTQRVMYAPAWQVHLQQVVIADDPLAYLGENLPN